LVSLTALLTPLTTLWGNNELSVLQNLNKEGPGMNTDSFGNENAAASEFGELSSKSVIDRLIFKPNGLSLDDINRKLSGNSNSNSVSTGMLEMNQISTDKPEESRFKGLVYLKKLSHSFRDCDLHFDWDTKYKELSECEIKFIHSIHYWQNAQILKPQCMFSTYEGNESKENSNKGTKEEEELADFFNIDRSNQSPRESFKDKINKDHQILRNCRKVLEHGAYPPTRPDILFSPM
jgi:hypothetical protein